jgi:hypothetical protein
MTAARRPGRPLGDEAPGDAILALRRNTKLTLTDLARILSVHHDTVFRWEGDGHFSNEESFPRQILLRLLALGEEDQRRVVRSFFLHLRSASDLTSARAALYYEVTREPVPVDLRCRVS